MKERIFCKKISFANKICGLVEEVGKVCQVLRDMGYNESIGALLYFHTLITCSTCSFGLISSTEPLVLLHLQFRDIFFFLHHRSGNNNNFPLLYLNIVVILFVSNIGSRLVVTQKSVTHCTPLIMSTFWPSRHHVKIYLLAMNPSQKMVISKHRGLGPPMLRLTPSDNIRRNSVRRPCYPSAIFND